MAGGTAKSSRLRRRRGYMWEDTLVRRFNGVEGWKAFRLGSPSVSLPDVLAVSTTRGSIYVIEAKSGTGTRLSVSSEQIERCLIWSRTFDIYENRQVVLAFKFMGKMRLDVDRYASRQLREYYKAWDCSREPSGCVCNYDGEAYFVCGGERVSLPDVDMPFQT